MTIDGFLLRYSDATTADFRSNPAAAPNFAAINGVAGNLVTIRGYYDAAGGVLPGTIYGSEESGVRPATAAEFAIPEAWVVSQGGVNRFPPRAGLGHHPDVGLLSKQRAQAFAHELMVICQEYLHIHLHHSS